MTDETEALKGSLVNAYIATRTPAPEKSPDWAMIRRSLECELFARAVDVILRRHVPEGMPVTPAAATIPEGWKLVPCEPTMEMCHAAMQTSRMSDPVLLPSCKELSVSSVIWSAMLAASPIPPATIPGGEREAECERCRLDGLFHIGPCTLTSTGEASEEVLADAGGAFQPRVQPWLLACFGAEIAADKIERNHRFLEEALELVQALGCTASEAHQLVDYTFSRDIGEPSQEVGGVMVTLAALCLARDLDMHSAGETELARIWTKVDAIRAKQAAKPKHSPLPALSANPVPVDAGGVVRVQAAWREMLREFCHAFGDIDSGYYAEVKEMTAAVAALAAHAAPEAGAPVAGSSDNG